MISVRYEASQLHGAHPVIQIGGFNIAPGDVTTAPSP
jgi:hypothetical protein